jgi:hypothetical protein
MRIVALAMPMVTLAGKVAAWEASSQVAVARAGMAPPVAIQAAAITQIADRGPRVAAAKGAAAIAEAVTGVVAIGEVVTEVVATGAAAIGEVATMAAAAAIDRIVVARAQLDALPVILPGRT